MNNYHFCNILLWSLLIAACRVFYMFYTSVHQRVILILTITYIIYSYAYYYVLNLE